MHLYIGVYLRELEADRWQAVAPDLPGSCITGHSSGEALARVRLALEGLIAERLGQEEALPEPRTQQQLEADGEASGEYYQVHINLRHLGALARHQDGRWTPAA
jgi:predicted RNase H-like HicB family nuclease